MSHASVKKSQNKNERSPFIVCATTKEYRFQTHAFCNSTEVVLEIGSAHGVTCNQIRNRCKNVVGIDIQQSLVEDCKKKYPRIPFYCKNVLNIEKYHRDILPKGCKKFTLIFIDIAGTIEIETLIPILSHVERVIRPKLIIVKSLNYSKLLIQLLKGYKLKVCNNKKLNISLDDNTTRTNHNNGDVDAKLMQIDAIGLATKEYLENDCKIQFTRLITSPCPFPRVWNGMKSSNQRAELCNMNNKMNFCRVVPSIITSSSRMILVFLPPGVSYDYITLNGLIVGSKIRRLKKGEIARNISRSVMETYRHLYIFPPFIKGFPILICDKILSYATQDKYIYFEVTLGEYIQMKLNNILDNKILNFVTTEMLVEKYSAAATTIDNTKKCTIKDGQEQSSLFRLFSVLLITFVCLPAI